MKDFILKQLLQKYGFSEQEFTINATEVVFNSFSLTVAPNQLNPEGQNIPGSNDWNYHNYFYPDGLIPGWDKILIQRYVDGPYKNRLQHLSLPVASFKNNAQEFLDKINLTYDTQHQFKLENNHLIFIVDYESKRGIEPAIELLNGLLSELTPRIAHNDDIKGPQFVSHLGRLAALILAATVAQARAQLLENPTRTDLLNLKDTVSSLQNSQKLVINKADLYVELEKLAREQQLLVQLISANLKMKERPWMAVDLNLLKNLKTNKSAQRLNEAIVTRKEPFYLSTTNGAHAFAAMLDFANDTLVLANPLGTYDNFAEVIQTLLTVSGCTKVIYANTLPLKRSGAIDFNDVCSADAISLAYMMMHTYQHHGVITSDSLNGQILQTENYLIPAPQILQQAMRGRNLDPKVSHILENLSNNLLKDNARVHLEDAKRELYELYGCLDKLPLWIKSVFGVLATILFPVAIYVSLCTEGYIPTFFGKSSAVVAIEEIIPQLEAYRSQ